MLTYAHNIITAHVYNKILILQMENIFYFPILQFDFIGSVASYKIVV